MRPVPGRFCIGMVPGREEGHYVATHFIFLLVAIPYQNIIAIWDGLSHPR